MTLEEIQARLRNNSPILEKRFKVHRIGVFGSYARGEQRAGSDLDVLVDFSEPIGWEFVDLKEYLEEILEMPVDVVTRGGLKARMRDEILRQVVYT